MNGLVIAWDDDEGHGRLRSDDGTEFFAHFSDIVGDGYRALEVGQRVTFTWDGIRETPPLPHASYVRAL